MFSSVTIETSGSPGVKGQGSSAGLQKGLVGLGQDLVSDLGVGDGPVFLPEVETQLALMAEVEVALLTGVGLFSSVDA